MPDSKARYSAFCQNGDVPLHFQPWWLDAACGAQGWNVALSIDKNGQVNGAFPYPITRRFGCKIIQLPPLTTYGGPWLLYPQTVDNKQVSRLNFEKKVLGALIRQLPPALFIKLNLRPELSNWLPFYWEGFRQTTRYTYQFEAIESVEKITQGFKHTLRTDLKKAAKWVDVCREDAAWAAVFTLNKASFARKNKRQPYTLEVFASLHEALQQRGQCATFMAYDKQSGKPSAGLYLVFDRSRASILLTGTAPEFKYQCAVYSLILGAIKFCAEHTLRLDFEGSMDPNIERSFRAFGAKLTPYSQISRIMWPM